MMEYVPYEHRQEDAATFNLYINFEAEAGAGPSSAAGAGQLGRGRGSKQLISPAPELSHEGIIRMLRSEKARDQDQDTLLRGGAGPRLGAILRALKNLRLQTRF